MGVVYPRFANTYAVHYLFQPDSLFLEWEMRKSELVRFTVALWMESGNIWEVLWPSGCLQSGETNKHMTRSSHFLSTSYLPNAFREERERFCLSLKTNYPFFLEAQNVNSLERERELSFITWGSALQVCAYLLLSNPQSNPSTKSHFSDEQTGPIRVNRLSQDHFGGNWHRLGLEPRSISF